MTQETIRQKYLATHQCKYHDQLTATPTVVHVSLSARWQEPIALDARTPHVHDF